MKEPVGVRDFRLKLYPTDFALVRSFHEQQLQFSFIKEWNRGDNDKGVMFDVGGTVLELFIT